MCDMQLVEVMYRAVARLNVQLGWVPDRLAEGNFNLEEPPERASPWVGVLLSHLATFRQKLDTAASLTPDDLALVRAHALAACPWSHAQSLGAQRPSSRHPWLANSRANA